MSRSIALRRSSIHGYGVFAAKDLPAEQEVIYYRGRLLTHEEADAGCVGDVDTGHTFLFTLNDKYVLDASVGGNWARWINHGCDPNCEALLVESDDGDPARDRIVIQTLRPIRAGEELTYDYSIEWDEPVTQELMELWACRCGAPRCTGMLLKVENRKRGAGPK